MRLLQLALTLAVVSAKKADAAEPPPGAVKALVSYVLGCVTPVFDSVLEVVFDLKDFAIAAPQCVSGLVVQLIDIARDVPGLVNKIAKADGATLDSLVDFCVTAGTVCFTVYVSVAALNLALLVACSAKTYVVDYLTLPPCKTVLGQPLPPIVKKVRDTVQGTVLNPIINWQVKTFMPLPPLSAKPDTPTLGMLLSSVAAAVSVCMMISCAPDVLALMRGGADKNKAEAILYTVGTALGLHYLVKRVSE